MMSYYRIFQLVSIKGEIHLKEAYLLNTDVFKYHNDKGNFNSYADARQWLGGLSTLKGEFIIAEVFVKDGHL